MALETIRYEVADGVGTVTLHRPHKLNALNTVMLEELLAVLDQADADDAVRALIVTGAGRAFCAGADLSGGGKTFDRVARRQGEGPGDHEDGGGRVTLRIYDMKKPLIAAINGPAVGFGITMTLPMDVRLASTAARIGFVFARRGVVPEACSTWFLPRLVGPSQAAEWVYTGRVFPAEEALAGRLVSRVVPLADLMNDAIATAEKIAGMSLPATMVAKEAVNRAFETTLSEGVRFERRTFHATFGFDDRAEGMAAFADKRKPAWKHR